MQCGRQIWISLNKHSVWKIHCEQLFLYIPKPCTFFSISEININSRASFSREGEAVEYWQPPSSQYWPGLDYDSTFAGIPKGNSKWFTPDDKEYPESFSPPVGSVSLSASALCSPPSAPTFILRGPVAHLKRHLTLPKLFGIVIIIPVLQLLAVQGDKIRRKCVKE